MKKNIFKTLCLVVLVFIGLNSLANDEVITKQDTKEHNEIVTQEDVKEHNEIVKSVSQEIEDVEQALKNYLDSKGLKTGLNNQGKNKGKGKYIVTHIATVTKEKNDKRFRDSVSIAYEKAYFGAQKKLAMEIFGKNISEKAISLFENNSDNVEEEFKQKLYEAKYNGERIDTIFGKVKKLAEVKLDNALADEGIPKYKLNSLSVKRKQELYKETFLKTVGESFTAKNLIGSTPIFTAMGMYNGAPAVGVVMMKTDKTSVIASDIANKRKPRVTKAKGKNPMDLLPENDKDYLKEFGVRLFFNENGFPAVISYAQKGVFSRSDKESRSAKAIASAKRKASMAANSQISEFVGVVMSAENKSTQGEKESTILENRLNEVTGVEEIVETTTDTLIDILKETANSSSQMDLAGTSEIYNWQTEDELGNKVVGVVKLWSYEQLSAAKRIITGKDIDYGTDEKQKAAMKNIMLKTKTSKDVVDVDDF